MADIMDIVDPLELTGFVRGLVDAAYSGTGTLAQYLPNQFRNALDYEFNLATRDRPEVARYRAFDAESGLSSRPGFSKVTGSIPPLSEKMLLSEADRTRLNLAFASGDTKSRYLRDLVFNDAERLVNRVLARVELARGSVLSTGTVTFTSEENLLTTVNYNDGASAIITNTASPLWITANVATATPIADMRNWMQAYADANLDDMPVVGLTSRATINNAMATTEVKNFFALNGTSPSLITGGMFEQLMSVYGVPPLMEFRTQVNINGVATRILPVNKIVWLPASDVEAFGETMFGIGSEALDLVEMAGLPVETAPGLTGRTWKTIDPPQNWTRVGGLVLPVLKDPKRIMVSTVS